MAKTGFWLKGANGKLAGATIYQSNGETVMREVVSPTNPKTEKQIIQRIIMHTVMQAYSKMKEICDHSFEGFKKGQETMSYFMSQNVGFAREKVATMQQQGLSFANMYNFVPLGLKGFTPNQYQVSMGSLPRVECSLRDDDESKAFVPVIVENTYAAVINLLGLQRGDQLTFLMIDANNAASFGQCNFHFCRVILDPTNTDYSQASLSVPFVDENGRINLPSVRNEGSFRFEITAEKGLSFTYNGSLTCVACAVIVSRKMNDKWLRSTAYLTYNGAEEYSMDECIGAAQDGTANTIYAAADAYLNNAGQGGGAAAEAAGDDNNGGSGSNSGQAPSGGSTTPAVSSASIDGQAMVAGTTKVVTLAYGTQFPVTKTLALQCNAAAAGQFISVKNHADSTEVATGTISNAGAASISHAWAKDTVYDVYIVDEDSEVLASTALSFSFAEGTDPNDPNGGDDY